MRRVIVAYAIACVLACAASCTSDESSSYSTAGLGSDATAQPLESLAQRYPGVAPLVRMARTGSVQTVADGYRLVPPRAASRQNSRWEALGQRVQAFLSVRTPNRLDLRVARTGTQIAVRRISPALSEIHALDRGVRVAGADEDGEAYLFATPAGIEELVLLPEPARSLVYRFELPAGWRLTKLGSDPPQVELRDASSTPRLRLAARRGWDAEGRELDLAMDLQGDLVAISMEGPARGPVLIDPSWEDPLEPRAGATITPLPTGKVLIAGGGVFATPSSTAELFDPVTGELEPVEPMQLARAAHTATLLRNGKVLLTGGEGNSSRALYSAELFDPATERFTPAGDLVARRAFHTATALRSGQVLLVGGTDRPAFPEAGYALRSSELYDPVSETFTSTGTLDVGRAAHTATRLPDGDVLIIGGAALVDDPVDWVTPVLVERYVTSVGTFEAAGSLTEARFGHAAVLLADQDRLLVAGGFARQHDEWVALSSMEMLDVASGVASSFAQPLSVARGYASASLLPGGKVLIAGGSPAPRPPPMPDAEIVDPVQGEVTDAGPMLHGCFFHGAAIVHSGRVLLGCEIPQMYDLAEPHLLEPSPGPMVAARTTHSATLLHTGQVLIIGGCRKTSWDRPCEVPVHSPAAELYDPLSRSFAASADQPSMRAKHTATRLPDGRVLLAGGCVAPGCPTELYEPSTGQFVEIAALHHERRLHSATLLGDGRVLIVGGIDPSGAVLGSMEVFDPQAGELAPFAANLHHPRWGHTASLLPSGHLLVAGGCDASSESADWFDQVLVPEMIDPLRVLVDSQPASVLLARRRHQALALPGGELLLAGGSAYDTMALFDPVTGLFSTAPVSDRDRYAPAATVLPSHNVLIGAGIPMVEVGRHLDLVRYLPSAAALVSSVDLEHSRGRVAAALLEDGAVLLSGGTTVDVATQTETALAGADLWRELGAASETLRPVVTNPSESSTVTPGSSVSLHGTGLAGRSEASGGINPAPSSLPIALWMPLVGVPALGTVTEWTESTATWQVPATSHPGPGLLFIVVNGIASVGIPMAITQAPLGVPCPADGACTSGFCTDGVCCDNRCHTECHVCGAYPDHSDLAGTCRPEPPGRADAACPGELPSTCGTTGKCDSVGRCERWPDGTECGDELACYDGQCSRGRCVGPATLETPLGVHDCAPFRCSPDQAVCLSSCRSNLDCAAGAACAADGRCVPIEAALPAGCAPMCSLPGSSSRGASWHLVLGAALTAIGAGRCRGGVAAARRRSRRCRNNRLAPTRLGRWNRRITEQGS